LRSTLEEEGLADEVETGVSSCRGLCDHSVIAVIYPERKVVAELRRGAIQPLMDAVSDALNGGRLDATPIEPPPLVRQNAGQSRSLWRRWS
jgi:hypothetical protein